MDGEISGTQINMCEDVKELEKEEQEVVQEAQNRCECCNQEMNIQDKDREAQRMHTFIKNYHKMTPHMIVQYNALYKKDGWEIKENYTEQELFEYVTAVKKAGKLEEILDFIENLI